MEVETPRPIRWGELALAFAVACALLLPGLWGHTLIDPWEGHYAEVGRRILVNHDWVHLHWDNEAFRSKPALTPWLIAASLRVHGLGASWSGEMVSTPLVMWAVRLPFALFAAGGLLSVWAMLARLVSRRAAWLGLFALAGMPFYLLVGRQAITDMPMVATTTGALALLALAVCDGEAPLRRGRARLTAHHLVLAAIGAVVAVQVVYMTSYFVVRPQPGAGVPLRHLALWMSLPFVIGFAAVVVLTCVVWPARRRRDAYLLAAYALLGVGVLGKGPPGAALAFVVCALYIVATGRWRLLRELRIVEGTLVALLVAAPWHLAMWMREGQPFLHEYFVYNWFERAEQGVHQVNRPGSGTLSYYLHALGLGMWPLIAAVPASLVAAARTRPRTPADHVRLLALLWAVAGLVLFTAFRTKFHHYILPAVPGFAVLVALWLDDVAGGRARLLPPLVIAGVAITLLISWEVAGHQQRIIELFIYRYDRPWPSAAPWHVNLSRGLWACGLASAAAALTLCVPRWRRVAPIAVVAVACASSLYLANRYMAAAGPHWGQRHLQRTYYRERAIHGARLHYATAADLAGDWPPGDRDLVLETFVPDELAAGAPMTITVEAGDQRAELRGTVSSIDGHRVHVQLPAADTARARALAPSAARGTSGPLWTQIEADRLIAFDLFWRSEIFWTGGELRGHTDDARTEFRPGDDARFRAYLARPDSRGRRFFAITIRGGENRLRTMLPATARASLTVEDDTSNKYILVSFEL